MKTLVLIACLLVVAYAANPAVLKRRAENAVQCAQELNKPPTSEDVIYCVLQKDGVIDATGKYMLDKGLALYDDLINDEAKRNQAKEAIRKCYNEMEYDDAKPETNAEITKKGIMCALPVQDLMDKA
ncbi:PREDICTED: uncharacterized protein LOC105569216 [Vollenhovia emeryi]|uniref:uncharacterized protein LOC105569216 n=1 Tax=Vollenhovia emeryi TaxID=411798 RepID=UPI0005F4AB3E|nr:PREDICTED: uncharacterized protein LOC105569216 [Vollenhovia emeryi]